jgi:hypothetical protein
MYESGCLFSMRSIINQWIALGEKHPVTIASKVVEQLPSDHKVEGWIHMLLAPRENCRRRWLELAVKLVEQWASDFKFKGLNREF